MRSQIVIMLHVVFSSSAFADDFDPALWTNTLREAGHCLEQSKPDFERAVGCYEMAIASCVSVPSDEYKLCLEVSVKELKSLLPLYNSHRQAEEISLQYDPKRCKQFGKQKQHNQPTDEFLGAVRVHRFDDTGYSGSHCVNLG